MDGTGRGRELAPAQVGAATLAIRQRRRAVAERIILWVFGLIALAGVTLVVAVAIWLPKAGDSPEELRRLAIGDANLRVDRLQESFDWGEAPPVDPDRFQAFVARRFADSQEKVAPRPDGTVDVALIGRGEGNHLLGPAEEHVVVCIKVARDRQYVRITQLVCPGDLRPATMTVIDPPWRSAARG